MIRRFVLSAALPSLVLAALVFTPSLNAAPTSTVVVSSTSPSTFGQQVSFTATVVDVGGVTGTPAGTVEFAVDGNVIGTAELSPSGVAIFSTALLPIGSHAIAATYIGTAVFDTSSGSCAQIVNLRPTSMTVSVSPTPVGVRIATTAQVAVTDFGPVAEGTRGVFATSAFAMSPRSGHTATLLRDGTVLIAGGSTGNTITRDAELYTPGTGFANLTPDRLNSPRAGHTATLLPNGTVLIVGGSSSGNAVHSSTEIFDAASASFVPSAAQLSTARTAHSATLLSTGKVLIAGGYDSDGVAVRSTELYDPALGAFVVDPAPIPLAVERAGHTATLLRDGTILFAGGGANTAERYDPVNRSTSFTGNLNGDRTEHAAALLPDGNVLLTGGTAVGTAVPGGELFDAIAGTFTALSGLNEMNAARAGHSATLLNSGLVLIAGGTNGDQTLGDTELYTPSFDPLGGVGLASDHAFDTFSGSCVLALSGTGIAVCQGGMRALQVGTGTHRITANYAGDTNHAGSTSSANLSIVVTTPTVLVADSPPAIYDGSPHPAQVRALAADGYQVPGTFELTYDGSPTAPTNAGTYNVAAVFTSSDLNFNSTTGTGTFTVALRSVRVSADSGTKMYGDPDPPLTYHVTSGSLVTGDAFTGAVVRVPGEDAGDYDIGQGTLLLSSNYALTYEPAPLTITPRPITVSANAKNKVYGTSDPVLEYSITAGALQFADAFTGALTRDHGESIGIYAIRQGTLALSSNYTLNYIGADFIVAPAGTRSQVRTRFTPAGLKLALVATVVPQFSGVPSGHVTFTDSLGGAFPGGTVTLAEGAAQFEVSLAKLVAGTHSLTAQYDQTDPNFAGAAITAPASLLVAPAIGATSGQSIPDVTVTVSNPTDQAVTLTALACQVEPAAGSVPMEFRPACALKTTPASLPPGSTSLTLTIGTVAAESTKRVPIIAEVRARSLPGMLLGLPVIAIVGLLLPAGYARRKRNICVAVAGLVLVIVVLLAMSGCGGGFDNPENLQPSTGGGTLPGSYLVVIRYTDAESNLVPLATVPVNISY